MLINKPDSERKALLPFISGNYKDKKKTQQNVNVERL